MTYALALVAVAVLLLSACGTADPTAPSPTRVRGDQPIIDYAIPRP